MPYLAATHGFAQRIPLRTDVAGVTAAHAVVGSGVRCAVLRSVASEMGQLDYGMSYETNSIASKPGITVALIIPTPDFSQYSASYPCRSLESSTIL